MADKPDREPNDAGISIKRLGVWVILIALAAVFGLSFGLPSDSLSFGPQPLARVHGTPIDRDDFTYELNAVTHFLDVPQDERTKELMGLRQQVLEGVVERVVLADAAEKMGLRSVLRDAEELTYNGNLIVLGETYPWLGRNEFNYQSFSRGLLPTLAVSEKNYLEHQRQEILARTVRDLLASTTVVPEAEVRTEYDRAANKLSLRYVRFATAHYAELVDPSPEEIDGYVGQHREELEAAFQSQGGRFTKLPPQVHLRYIKVDKPTPPAEDAEAEVKARFEESRKKARTLISNASKRIDAGEDFRVVARELSQDPATARAGGDYGWVSVQGTGSGLDPLVDQAAATLADNEHSEIIEGEEALWIVRVDGHREGDVPQEDALRELAAERLAQDHGKSLAKQAAAEALLALKGGKSMDELFAAPDALGGGGIEALPLGESPVGMGEPAKPQVRETGLFNKDKTIPGIGAVPELTKAAWQADEKAEVIDDTFEVADGYILAGIDTKEVGSDEGFAEQRDEIFRALAARKARRITSHFAHRRCLEAKGRGDITTNEPKLKALMTYDTRIGVDEAGNAVMKPYSMCERVGTRGGMLNPALMFGGGGR